MISFSGILVELPLGNNYPVMIQLIDSLPFTEDFASLKSDWTRFQEGKVIVSEIPDAICGEFECEAEIQEIYLYEEEEEEGDDESTNEGKCYETESLKNFLLSSSGKLILTAR